MKSTSRISTGLVAMASVLLSALASAQSLTVSYPTHQNLSPRMSELHGSPFVSGPTVIHRPLLPPQAGKPDEPDVALQVDVAPLVNATLGASFDGMSVYNGGYIPSDNNIAVGPNHVAEVVNAAFAVYSKAGALLLGPVPLKNLWANLTGSACAANNGGDPIVQYDRAADRWMVTQLGSLSNPYSQCIAVSQTKDPTGAYHLYSYAFGTNLNDYPKFGVWPTATNSAYLATYNLFANGASFVGAEICAYDRAAMLTGAASPAALCYTGITGASFLPVDLDGATPPLDGTPAYFMNLYGASLGVYTLAPDFSVLTATLSPFSTIGVAGYTRAASSPQPGTTRTLDALSDRLMYRLAFRMFSDHESIVVNHSVAPSGNSGVRWYELRSAVSSAGTFSLYQQGTFAPDSSYRWMGSAAMDQAGDIAIGYTVSDGGSTYPSVRYTGRTPGDAPGTMATESTIVNGLGSQTGYSRWGDYSSMRIDPSDDCTFWYVNEYLPVTHSYGWYTRIGSFRFSNCTSNADFSISATPGSASIAPGQTATSTVGVSSLNGYTGTVNLTVSGCPANATCSLSPASVVNGLGSSTLSVTKTSTTPAGTYPVTVAGTDSVNGGLTHSATFTVTVVVPDFSISANPTSFAVTQGNAGTSTINLASINGYAKSVTLGTVDCPSNATCTFLTNPVTPTGASTFRITTATNTPAGGYTIAVTGTDPSALAHSANLTVTVSPLFTMPASLSLTVTRGSGNSVALKPGLVGTAVPVTLSISSLPKGVKAVFSPNPVNSGIDSTLTISATRAASRGLYNLTIQGNNGSYIRTTNLALTIN